MYDTHDYLWGLGVYACGGLLAMLFLYLYCRKIPWLHLRNLILLLAAVLIFTPVTAYPDKSYLAPAWFVSLFEGFTIDEPNSFLRGLTPLLITTFFVLLFYVATTVFLWYRRRTQAITSPASEPEPEPKAEPETEPTETLDTEQLENP